MNVIEFDHVLHCIFYCSYYLGNILTKELDACIKYQMGSEDENEILITASKIAVKAKESVDLLVKKREDKVAEVSFDFNSKHKQLKSNLTGRFEGSDILLKDRVIYKNGAYFIIVCADIKGKKFNLIIKSLN